MNIQDIREKIKQFRETLQSKEIYTALLIILVGLCSFGLGRLSLLEGHKVPIQISNAIPFESPQVAAAVGAPPPLFKGEDTGGVSSVVKGQVSMVNGSAAPVAGGQLVASKGGAKYHFPWCSGAQRISEANKIWFNSVEAARKAGYTPASNCKGLK